MQSSKTKMRNLLLLGATSTLLSTGCATDPIAPPPTQNRPELPVRVPPGPDFASRMQSFLSGKQVEPIASESDLKPATNSQTR